MGCGSGPGPELGARVAERGRAVHEQGKSQRERERERERERWLSGGIDSTVGPTGRESRERALTRGPLGLIKFDLFQTDSNSFKFDLIHTGPSYAP
jgi:hypothetical protein